MAIIKTIIVIIVKEVVHTFHFITLFGVINYNFGIIIAIRNFIIHTIINKYSTIIMSYTIKAIIIKIILILFIIAFINTHYSYVYLMDYNSFLV